MVEVLPTRWSHLARYGLLGTTLLGARASASTCDGWWDTSVNALFGVELAPRADISFGVELRQCVTSDADVVVRIELTPDAPRLIVGARVYFFTPSQPPIHPPQDDDYNRELLGFEGGLSFDRKARLAVHVAGSLGSATRYVAIQSRVGEPRRVFTLGLMAGWGYDVRGKEPDKPKPGRPLSWRGQTIRPSITTTSVTSGEDRAVRDHFASCAQLEFSSVWTFLRLAAELAAVGASEALVLAALDAADDEVRHAELCAKAAGGVALSMLPPFIAQPRFTKRSPRALALLAEEALLDGCINEGVAAEEARLTSAEACAPISAMLATIANDEARHAELSWNVLAWIASIAPELIGTRPTTM